MCISAYGKVLGVIFGKIKKDGPILNSSDLGVFEHDISQLENSTRRIQK